MSEPRNRNYSREIEDPEYRVEFAKLMLSSKIDDVKKNERRVLHRKVKVAAMTLGALGVTLWQGENLPSVPGQVALTAVVVAAGSAALWHKQKYGAESLLLSSQDSLEQRQRDLREAENENTFRQQLPNVPEGHAALVGYHQLQLAFQASNNKKFGFGIAICDIAVLAQGWAPGRTARENPYRMFATISSQLTDPENQRKYPGDIANYGQTLDEYFPLTPYAPYAPEPSEDSDRPLGSMSNWYQYLQFLTSNEAARSTLSDALKAPQS